MKYNKYREMDPHKDYFMLPNDIFSLDLCPGEIAVYAYLLRCENRKTYQCYPSYTTISKSVGMTVKTVQKYVQMLEDKRLISTEPTMIMTQNFIKKNGSLLYTIHPFQEAVEYFTRRQIENNMRFSNRICK